MTNVVTSYTETNADSFVTVTVVRLDAFSPGVWIPAVIALALSAILVWRMSRRTHTDSR